MPAAEFIQHKIFFDKFKWGMEQDMLAMLFTQVLGLRTGTVSKVEQNEWKDMAFVNSGPKKKVRTNSQGMRNAFMTMAHSIGKEVKNAVDK